MIKDSKRLIKTVKLRILWTLRKNIEILNHDLLLFFSPGVVNWWIGPSISTNQMGKNKKTKTQHQQLCSRAIYQMDKMRQNETKKNPRHSSATLVF